MIHAILLVSLTLQVKMDVGVQRDSTDSIRKKTSIGITIGPGGDSSRKREPKRIPVTDAHRRTAFKIGRAHV